MPARRQRRQGTAEGLRAAAAKVAGAILRGAEGTHERRGPGRYRATVVRFGDVDDFLLDVHGQDLELDEEDVTLSEEVLRTHADTPIDEDDIMVLVEIDELDFSAIAVERP